jgi:peptidoglycan/xylan/chitin deacetylase (PgdA/CDA1 family)
MKLFSLSYDDGPMEWTLGMLDALKEFDSRATFFSLGARVEGNEDILRRMVAEGSEAVNHGWTHTPMTKLDSQVLRDEFLDTRDALENVVGKIAPIWRPPYHNRDARVMEVSRELGLMRVGTDNDPGDYGDAEDVIFNYVTKRLREGSIVNLHDGMPPPPIVGAGWDHRRNTVAGTRRILAWAAERGMKSVTVSELLAANGGTHPLVTDAS